MDAALDQDEPVLAVNVVIGLLEVLAHVRGLLDEEVEFLRESRSEAVRPQNALDLVARDCLDLADAVAITEEGADLRRTDALLGVIADQLDTVLGGELEPVWSCAAVWGGGGGDTLAWGVKTTHLRKVGPNRSNGCHFYCKLLHYRRAGFVTRFTGHKVLSPGIR